MTPLEQITGDLNWRESELGSLKILLSRHDLSNSQREVLLRAAWAILYAHYEGFSKFCLTVFYDEATRRVDRCGRLPKPTRVTAFFTLLKKMRSLPNTDFLDEIEAFCSKHHTAAPVFPEVDTKSNLWPSILVSLLKDADIDHSGVDNHHIRLRTLVARRNDIAHGKKNIINDVSYYMDFEATVYDLMYDLAFCIDRRLNEPPYKEA